MEEVRHKLNEPINLDVFKKNVTVPALKVPTKELGKIMANLKPILMAKKGKKNVYPDPENPNSQDFKVVGLTEELSEKELSEKIKTLLPNANYPRTTIDIPFDYTDYNYFEALKLLLPKTVTTPSGFETIGHIAHLNLKENQFPWKYLIGQVIRDKTKEITTVVNKLDKLSNEYRTPELELISGEKNYETAVHEEKTVLHLDFEKVYWCSKLQGERNRVLETLTNKDVICDAFCGVGPFAVRAAKEKGCKVYASDLNPLGTEYLRKNIKVNKVTGLCEPDNKDARLYIQEILDRAYKKDIVPITRWFMNLPGDAVEFLDAFTAYYKTHPENLAEEMFLGGLVHVYCFLAKDTDAAMRAVLVERVQKVMPNFEESDIDNIHTLKSVSSDKDMCCLTFRLNTRNCNPTPIDKPVKIVKTE